MRLYFIVMYNLSPIQKGIQAGHAALEYVEEYGDKDDYKEFIKNHKTWIILDGGGSEQVREAQRELDAMHINHSYFIEPDLNNAMSCVTFLVPEEIYDAEKVHYSKEEWAFGERFLSEEQNKFKNWLNKFSLAR